MLTSRIKELTAAKKRLAAMESKIASELTKELAALPVQYGFGDVASFVAAVQAATGKRRGRKPGSVSGKPRRTRAVITEATRADVKKLVTEGKTGAAIAAALKISLPSVQNIKKALGLVKVRT